MHDPTRRRMLSATATAVAALAATAGCTGDGGDDGTTTAETTDGETTTTTRGGGNGGTTTTAGTTTTPSGTTTSPGTTVELSEPPDTDFQFVYDADEETLLMANSGVGAYTEVNTDRLIIRVDGEDRTTWELPVEPSDTNSVEVVPGSTVELVWVGHSGEEVVVATHRT